MDGRKRSILVVEDEQPLLKVAKAKLEHHDFDVVTARTVEQAWNTLRDGVEVDAVWLDHYLIGQETGLDFLAKLKADDARKDIPVFVVSNTATSDKRQAYIEFGVSNYFVKSNNRLEEIIEAIDDSLHAKES